MFSKIDPVANATANAGAAQQTRRADADKILEAYQSISSLKVEEKRTVKEADPSDVKAFGAETKEARAADEVKRAERVRGRSSTTAITKRFNDQADIAFQLTREERDVFLDYVTGETDSESLTDQEEITLQRVTERLSKLIEEADARSAKGRNRINAAMKQWFSRLSGGKEVPAHLIDLIQQAAQGKMDDQL